MITRIKSPVGKFIYKYFMIVAGSVLYALAISLFLDPNRLAPGGVTGIAIIINHYTNHSTRNKRRLFRQSVLTQTRLIWLSFQRKA